MLDTELLDVVNSGNAWLFVGSGVSAEAGLPSWRDLVTLTINELDPRDRDAVQSNVGFVRALERCRYPICFQHVENVAGRPKMEEAIKQVIAQRQGPPGELCRLIADWPVAGYLTTNYDDLLEHALRDARDLGWISVGNQPREVRKSSGDVRNIVWHVHGAASMGAEQSRLVVSTKDYDALYLEHSDLQQQLKSFLAQRRLVFVGFGFRDPDVMRILKIAGRYTVPERPIYAFLGTDADGATNDEFRELREDYNVEVKPYRVIEDSHADLLEVLKLYASMVVKRSIPYKHAVANAPSYDEDTTGLLIYNALVMRYQNSIEEDRLTALMSSRVLSLADARGPLTLDDVYADVGRMEFSRPDDDATETSTPARQIPLVIDELEDRGYISRTDQQGITEIRLTDSGSAFVAERSGVADRIRAQFRASVTARSEEIVGEHPATTREVTEAAIAFFEDSINKRSLGVAMALNAPDHDTRDFQVVALLQNLPEFFSRLSDINSARALIKVVQGVLSSPSEAEAKHYGLLLQSRLGVHLLGVDPNTLKSRMEALKNTAFVMDSSSLIPLIAVSGTGHKAAVELLRRITLLGAKPLTTRNLVVEVSEHAVYAIRSVSNLETWNETGALDNLMGRSGSRANVFLSGYAAESAAGSIAGLELDTYMRQLCGFTSARITDADCSRLINAYSIPTLQLSEVSGFDDSHHAEFEELYSQIEERRLRSNSFRHERQVTAEAEAVVLVQKLRQSLYTIDGRTFDGSYFVSNSRFIDTISRVGLPITMRDNVLLQLLGTVTPFEEAELPVLMDGLLWELSERGIDFVDRKKLRAAFSGMISAAKGEYPQVVARHKQLIATDWGVDPDEAFQDTVDDIDLPSLIPQHARQLIVRQGQELQRLRTATATMPKPEDITQSEKMAVQQNSVFCYTPGHDDRPATQATPSRREHQRGRAATISRGQRFHAAGIPGVPRSGRTDRGRAQPPGKAFDLGAMAGRTPNIGSPGAGDPRPAPEHRPADPQRPQGQGQPYQDGSGASRTSVGPYRGHQLRRGGQRPPD